MAKPKPKKVASKPAAPEPSAEAIVVADMQRFFHAHGYYRAQDVHQILGSPVGGLTIETPTDVVFCAKSEK
jgi:hypothetical protein